MSEKRLVSQRYGEPVFPDSEWSPTVGEVVALIHFAEGSIISDNLLAALDKKILIRSRNQVISSENTMI